MEKETPWGGGGGREEAEVVSRVDQGEWSAEAIFNVKLNQGMVFQKVIRTTT